ncbi:MAG: PaaI family thioesterase [Sphingobacteriia bacterium]|nr:PaaI family thioesterase [Sphingobacteriia bacterium]
MSNTKLNFLQSLIGQHLDNSPSPVGVWLNGKLKAVSPGSATVEYTVRKEMTNPLGTLQGGVFAVMMDDALGVAVYSLGKDKLYVSSNFYIDFLAGVNEGDNLVVRAEVLREGNTVLNVNIIAENPEGKMIAAGKCNLISKDFDGLKLPLYKGMDKKYPGLIYQQDC